MSKPVAAKSITINQISIKVKDGKVGVGYKIGEKPVDFYFAEDLAYEVGKKENSMPNVLWELASILAQTAEEAKPGERTIIAVPGSIADLCNKIELMTRMLWTKRMILESRNMEDIEYSYMKKIFISYKALMGKAIIIDSEFTPKNAKEGQDEQAKIWVEINKIIAQNLFGRTVPKAVIGMDALANMNDDIDIDL